MGKYFNVRQLDATDCAAACLATVSFYYGLETTITRLRDICGTDIKGTNLNGLALGAQKLNYDVKQVRITSEQLMNEKITMPFIAHGVNKYGLTHFIVVYKIKKNYLIVADPSKKEKKMMMKDFLDFFDGVIVLLKPNSEFVGGQIKGGTIFSKFIKLLLPHKKLFITAIVSSVILTIIGILSNFFNQILIDDILPYNLKNQLTIFCIGFLIISVISIVLGALRQHILLYLSQKVDIPLTLGYFKHIFKLPMSFFGTRKTGDILARFQDAGTIKNVMSGIALSVLIDVTMVGIVGVVLYFMNPKLFIVILILTLINIVLVYIFKKPYKKINIIQMEQSAKLNSNMIESLKSVELIKSNSIEDERMEQIENSYIDVVRTSFKENVLSNVQGIISSGISTIGNLIIMWIGATFVMNGDITLGALMTFTSMSGFFMDPVGRLVGLQLQIQEANIAMKRLSEVYDVEEENLGEEKEVSLEGNIKIENVTFRYGSRTPVIKNVSMDINKGERIALVGESGSGKTTLAKLMLGLWFPEEGNIKYNDTNIIDLGLINVRNKIAYVNQNVDLFSGTIKENIKIVNPNVSDDKIKIALKFAGCDFVYKMPCGIDTYLEEAGANLSGGERQRLAFARALVKEFDVLILDEATSNLDFISESRIYNTLFNSNLNQTMMIIAHRLSTIRKCDRIFVMDNGEIVEVGTHEALLDKKGKYYDLWISQIGDDYVIKSSKEVKIGDVISYE